MRRSPRMRSSVAGMASGSTWSGHVPSKPSSSALSLPWPRPVSASEPNSSHCTRATSPSTPFSSSQRLTKRAAAGNGPTVCEDDGPMPILNRSKVLTAMADPARRREQGEGCVFYAVIPNRTLRRRMQLQLYQRDDCHLCDLALAVLAAARTPEFASVWIDDDPVLEARYGERV